MTGGPRRVSGSLAALLAAIALLILGAPPALAVPDTDHDGLRDAFERRHGLDPRSRDSDRDGLHDPSEDLDGDDLGNLGEQLSGTDPRDPDSDGDGRPDGQEDADRDGIANRFEQDRRPLPRNVRPALRLARDDHTEMLALGCQAWPDEVRVRTCTFGDRRSRTTVVLFGDSHASQWQPAADQAGRKRGWKLVTLTKSGCPAPDLVAGPSSVRVSCGAWRQRALAWLRAHPPDLVVLSAAPSYTLHDAEGRELDPAAAAAAWGDAYRRTLAALPPGVRVVLLGVIPRPTVNVVDCLRAHRLMSRCGTRLARGVRPGWAEAEQAAAADSGVPWGTLADKVCPYDPCPAVSDGIILWRDSLHVTRTFSRSLWRSFARIVATGLEAEPPPPAVPGTRRGHGRTR